MSFAAGKYARYKRATAFFLDWLLRARGRGRHTAQRVQLEAFNEVVKEIAADPSCLTPKLLQELPKALAACRYAILLREHVAAFFPEDHEGQIIRTALNHHFQYLHIANEVMFATSRFRAFGHLYNALVQEGYLEHIPFFDKVLEVYDQEIFTPSRAAATHGSYYRSYYRSYLLSSNLRASAIDAVYRGENFPVGSEAYKKRKAFHLSDVSEIFRLMRLNDKSVLSGGSWKAMLEAVSDACSKELFDMRVLSRDLLKLNEDLMDTFPEMIAVLGQQKYFQEIIAHPRAGESRQQRVNRALEESVMNLLIPLLDAIQPHNSLDLSALPCNMPTTSITLDGLLATEMCKGVAVVIKTRFATPPQICEQKYFTFPSQPDFATQEYGKLLLKEKTESESENSGKVFTKLMKLMSEGDGPLSASDLNYLKSEVKNDPDLLSMAVPNTETPYAELYTLLHQAAAGPAHDAELVEWMVQMGALIGQPLHCRKELIQKELSSPPKFLPNTMAVHSAAIAGYADIVRVLVESDNMVDLNTRTFHTKETLAHLAVKHGHRDVFELVKAFGIDLRSKDCDGRRVCDVTSNHKWSREIAASTANFRKNTLEDVRKREALFRSQDAERRSQLATAQRNEENENTTGSRNAVTSKTAKKKKNKMKGNTIMNDGTTVESIIATAAESTDNSSVEMARIYLRLLHAAGADVDESFESESVSRLESMLRSKETATFSRLKDPNVPASEKVDDAESARKMIKEMMWLVKSHAEPSSLNSTYRHIRAVIATEASIGIHFMQKFYRVDHAAIVVPELTHVRELCETTIKFADLVVSAAQLSVSVDRDSQARQILDVLEKRLLKTPFPKRDPSAFREVVQTYSRGRDAMGLGRTSNADVFRRLEWYLMNVVESYDLQLTLDGLVGSPFYLSADQRRPQQTSNSLC
ncbi:hypothetical protein PF005_g16728 [Phytophthora fragariae]|uniref:Uncharacterized protein n=2 Tax=Phytophthora fragariae TaxID=53985 RepID=A0A6A3JTQ6_9STRA|nr:hypothetical protein PF003_g394 [Phytophthora fragariae]KAE8937735.1 hypothetical protein PF009_g12378 [Phytophthora fragariae]KAE8996778.1 hypothetical protein PF011_g15765 [Phytophthora fragariae]KAE9098590.1 hypothetical protein PF007_g16203 [Phytophthora fragariae]KAE9132582.1 hypothetical protein PF006_g15248 [Phytophthora fragariae]